ncbi:tRNA3(Ser)-specific nuclease WapA precursor [Planctomycetes bacterium CA13]|uniref:tRNA3(Ser)-specific nuclease WapA n=1 Tax=Novipirellula herctigrandis TaxID=2527986 RepID=A0A5C5YZ22_9BACT|nr:tRNA3(Ser)-specific nuclease WapA precursor [Planctomycetes bacterium CA13]
MPRIKRADEAGYIYHALNRGNAKNVRKMPPFPFSFRDANKNKTSETITGTMSGYGFNVGTSGYDDEDRLVNWNRSDSNLDQSWNLSLVGDWNNFTENASVQSRTHGPTHEILSAAGQAVQHDAKGNQTLLPTSLSPLATSLSLHWDFENKLLGADTDNDGSDDVTYQFDALGRRVARDDGTTVTVFVQSGQQTIADYVSGAVPASPTYTYVYASYIDEPVMRGGTGGLRYYHRNQQYSIIGISDGGGVVKERYAYTAYGTPTILDAAGVVQAVSAENNRYLYTGREWDAVLGLCHYRARMYDPVLGRFCSRDPIGYVDGTLSYGFLVKAVLKKLDPHGFYATTDNDVKVALGCLKEEVKTLDDPRFPPGTLLPGQCAKRPFHLAMKQMVFDEWGDLNADIVVSMISPILGDGVTGAVKEAIASEIASAVFSGDSELTAEEIKDLVTSIVTAHLNDEINPSWDVEQSIQQIADQISGLVPTEFENCKSVVLTGDGSGEKSTCRLTVCAQPHPTQKLSMIFTVKSGFCSYSCVPKGRQRCCCGTNSTVTLGPTTGSALNIGSDCSVQLGAIR